MRYLFIFAAVGCLSAVTQKCERTSKNCMENPKKDCMCPMVYDPVCGCNNKTYSNACDAECHGITTFAEGECPNKN